LSIACLAEKACFFIWILNDLYSRVLTKYSASSTHDYTDHPFQLYSFTLTK